MATIPDTPDVHAALAATVAPIQAALKRLGQLHQLGGTEEAQVAALRAERDAALTDVETLRRLHDTAQADLDAERAKVAALEAKLASYETHPDVIAQRRARLEAQKAAVQAELDRLGT